MREQICPRGGGGGGQSWWGRTEVAASGLAQGCLPESARGRQAGAEALRSEPWARTH